MPLNFPQENPEQTPEEIAIPGVASIVQLEEVNRVLTANLMAILSLIAKLHAQERDDLLILFQNSKEAALQELDNQFQRELEKRCGPDRHKQQEYLMQNPDAILFSGLRINQ